MYDLHVPVERYDAEKYKMTDLLNNLDENKELVMAWFKMLNSILNKIELKTICQI